MFPSMGMSGQVVALIRQVSRLGALDPPDRLPRLLGKCFQATRGQDIFHALRFKIIRPPKLGPAILILYYLVMCMFVCNYCI